MILYVQELAIADFFGAFALVAMDHVAGDIRFLLDFSDQLVAVTYAFKLVMIPGFLMKCWIPG